jgi:predicted nucleic acid-binding protein
MILYVDTSALVKKYIQEEGTDLVLSWLDEADMIGTALVTRVELAATLTRAVKASRLSAAGVQDTLKDFRSDWEDFHRVAVDEALVAYADSLACEHGLRGYDAIHLACALTWKNVLRVSVTLITFDGELRGAALQVGLAVLPA